MKLELGEQMEAIYVAVICKSYYLITVETKLRLRITLRIMIVMMVG